MKLKNPFKKIFSSMRLGGIEKKPLYSPYRDWLVIILIFGILIMLSVGAHYGLYVLVDNGTLFNKVADQEMFRSSLKREALKDVVEIFNNKAINTEVFNQNRANLTDPS